MFGIYVGPLMLSPSVLGAQRPIAQVASVGSSRCCPSSVATLYSLSTNPLVDFDVDTYLSINRALSLGSSIDGGGVSSDGTMIGGGEIVELPALSPAEQIVGAFFGPPRH